MMLPLLLAISLAADPTYQVGIVHFSMPANCAYCRQIEPVIAQLSRETTVWRIDATKQRAYADAWGVRGVPDTFVVVVTGTGPNRQTRVVERYIGVQNLATLRNAVRRANPYTIYVPARAYVRPGGT